MQRRIILAATALAAALVVPTMAGATDKQAGPGDRAVPEAWQNRDQGTNTSTQNQMAVGQGPNSAPSGPVGGSTPTGTGVGQAVGGHGPTQQLTGHIGGSTQTGQAGGDGTTAPIESALNCAPAKGKTPAKGAKKDDAHEKTTPDVPKADDEADLEDELREQQEMLDRLTDLLNQMQQRNNDITRGITGG